MKANIWSNPHMGWWTQNGDGYTKYIEEAGLFNIEEAKKICEEDPKLNKWISAKEIPIRQRRSIIELLQHFKDGEKRMCTSASFHQTIRVLEQGEDPLKIIDQLLLQLDDQERLNFDLLKRLPISIIKEK